MSGVVQFQKAGRRLRQQPSISPLVAEIADALHCLGGQAHRDVIINCLAAARRNNGEDPPRSFGQDIVEAFHDHLQAPSPGPCLLALPFGPDSRRWGLTPAGAELMRSRLRTL